MVVGALGCQVARCTRSWVHTMQYCSFKCRWGAMRHCTFRGLCVVPREVPKMHEDYALFFFSAL